MINIEKAILSKYPGFAERSGFIRKPTLSILRKLVYERKINNFLENNQDAWGIGFVDRVLDYFGFKYTVTTQERNNIPDSGRVLIFANHPIGSLDGLAILRLVSEVRSDVKIVANDMLSNFEALQDLIIPLDNMAGGGARRSYKKVLEALNDDQAIIVFPAGEVSRASPTGVKDTHWRPGFLHFARKTKAPLLPIHIGASNSWLFYAASILFKPLGTALLAHEMFNKQDRVIKFRVGQLINNQALASENLHDRTLVKRLKSHLYKIGHDRKPIFQTEKTIAYPEDKKELEIELETAKIIGDTRDGNRIYLVDYKKESAVIHEIGRLRELAFRMVGEGTGKNRDLDAYDEHYQHLVLWDKENLTIAGAYRLGLGSEIMKTLGEKGFYTRSLYQFTPSFSPYLTEALELGRSFVNPKYWGKASLDYLWQGLGAYLSKHPEIRYLLGPVSMSADYPKQLMDMLAYFYRRFYSCPQQLATANNPYILSDDKIKALDLMFLDKDKDEAFDCMQKEFIKIGYRLPILYKQYAALFEEGGFQAIVFSVDPDFGDCLDGLCMVDITKLKDNKRKRYFNSIKEHS